MNVIKKMQRVRIGPVGEAVLVTIGVAGILTLVMVAPNAFQMFAPFFKKKKHSPNQEIQRNINALINAKLLKRTRNKDGEIALELTRRGKWEYILRHKRFDITAKKKWDGRWRIVVFDVPNDKGKLRTELRKGMKLYGFHMIQKSVWVFPYACDDFVTILRSHLQLHDDVLYMTVDTIENEAALKRRFSL